jgi:hypothetical protein
MFWVMVLSSVSHPPICTLAGKSPESIWWYIHTYSVFIHTLQLTILQKLEIIIVFFTIYHFKTFQRYSVESGSDRVGRLICIGGHRHRPSCRRYPTSDIDISYSDIGTKYVGLNPFIPILEEFRYRHQLPFRYWTKSI